MPAPPVAKDAHRREAIKVSRMWEELQLAISCHSSPMDPQWGKSPKCVWSVGKALSRAQISLTIEELTLVRNPIAATSYTSVGIPASLNAREFIQENIRICVMMQEMFLVPAQASAISETLCLT